MPGMKIQSLAMLCCLSAVAHAERGSFDHEFEQGKPWVEVAAQLPPYPEPVNLVPFSVSAATANRFFIDTASISVGSDNVVRYTVVIEAVGGARNVSFEGIRCESGERRFYAYGHPGGGWSKARGARWEAIPFSSLLSYHKALFEDHFCAGGLRVKDAAEAVRSLRQGAR